MLNTAENYYRAHTAKMHRVARKVDTVNPVNHFMLASILRNKPVGSTEGWGPVNGWPEVPANGLRSPVVK